MLEVEDWTQPAPSKRRASSKKAQPDVDGGNTALALAASIPLPAGPPEVTEEEATLAPSSHLFPFRGASPPARPSALSRLLAQAPPSAAEGAAAPAPEPRQDERSTPDPEPEQDMPVPASGPSVSDLAASRPLLENPAPSEGTPEPEPAPAPTSEPEPSPTSEPEPDADPVPAAPASSPTILAPSFVADEPAPSEYHDVPTSAPTPVPATLTLALAPGAPPATMPRPMSRASRMSISSRFSPGKLPAFPVPGAALAKASPTTAISELPPIPADPFLESPTDTSTPGPLPPPAVHERARSGSRTPTLSPTGSMGEDMSRALLARRRTSSYHFPRTSPLAAATVNADATPAPSPLGAAAPSPSAGSGLAGLVGSWGFGRKRRSELAVPQDQRAVSASAATQADARTRKESQSRASELLRRF
jgi:autophagy-related protein 11